MFSLSHTLTNIFTLLLHFYKYFAKYLFSMHVTLYLKQYVGFFSTENLCFKLMLQIRKNAEKHVPLFQFMPADIRGKV